MPVLPTPLRKDLETVCTKAREAAEAAARSALQKRAVDQAEPFGHFTEAERAMRNRLRARGRQAGDVRAANKTQAIDQLTQELAYEFWHRMLFARFLAENGLLMHPDGVAVSLEDCEELAADERAPNGLALAARYASRMLPEIFRIDDVLLEVEFAPEHRLALEKLLAGLPRETFLADDSLGWVYQFWQATRKDEVNKSGAKIDGRTLPAVTQLFTEHYMVEFLLHNTIGAWWCARNGIQGPPGGAGVPEGQAPVRLDYLRWRDDGTPAAGAFEGWPRSLAEFTMLDPCCGSGHFLVAAFRLLVPLRRHDEGLSARDACDAVLRDNLFGLELDPRCTQIAAFALALAAWTQPGDDGQPLGHWELPPLNIACSGQGVVGTKEDWTRFANGDSKAREGMERLYDLFRKAPTLGSLIDPGREVGDLFALGFQTLRGTVEHALKKIEAQADPDRAAVGVAAQGVAFAASLMAREFTLVATNVPYLARGKQAGKVKVDDPEDLRDLLEKQFPLGKSDLATAFVERCLAYCAPGGSTALVTPQNWLFLGSYRALREWLLRQVMWEVVAKLGPGAFETISGEVVNVALSIYTAAKPYESHELVGLDASEPRAPREKAEHLKGAPSNELLQSNQLGNPDAVVTLSDISGKTLLTRHAFTSHGQGSFDAPRFELMLWELPSLANGWVRRQSTSEHTKHYAGCFKVFRWEDGLGQLAKLMQLKEEQGYTSGKWKAGVQLWGKRGVLVKQMGSLTCSLYLGCSFDENASVITPEDPVNLPAVWAFCSSEEFESEVRKINQKINVTTSALAKVPFDLERWQKIAAEEYPDGLPEPHSDDPTQWLFRGHPKGSTDPLQVAVARLLGYRWPEQEPDDLDRLADADGIVPLPAVRGEPPAAERLQEVLRAAYGPEWSASRLDRLLTDAGSRPGTTLDVWLRKHFFEQHSKRFHHRPFLWHIWDGRDDGFACLVNYHKLTPKALETLTYAYLQDWINAQAADARAGKVGADLRLAAAQALQETLKLILAGEPPHDIFVRWKPLAEQPLGWNPDLNDGVRLNIRPFMTAGILRKNPNIKWTKDRGKEPNRPEDQYPWFYENGEFTGNRVNDVHLTNAQKQAARDAAPRLKENGS